MCIRDSRSQKQILADGYISKRGGRYVLPVQRRFQHQFSGSVVEVSGRGSTVFMEPAAVSKLQAEMDRLAVEEDGEVDVYKRQIIRRTII